MNHVESRVYRNLRTLGILHGSHLHRYVAVRFLRLKLKWALLTVGCQLPCIYGLYKSTALVSLIIGHMRHANIAIQPINTGMNSRVRDLSSQSSQFFYGSQQAPPIRPLEAAMDSFRDQFIFHRHGKMYHHYRLYALSTERCY